MKIQCIVDSYKSTRKPNNNEKGHASYIKKRVINNNIKTQEITLEDLSIKLSNGYAVIPAVLNGGASDNCFNSQQLFMIDIDNKDEVLTIENALFLCRDFKPFLIYATFNYTDIKPKYRLAFVLDKMITSKDERDYIQQFFLTLFNNYADNSCKDCSRIFYGGKQILYKNFNNIISADSILKDYKKKIINKTISTIDEIPLLDYILDEFPQCKEKRTGRTITINPCPLCNHNDDFHIYEDNTFCAYSDKDIINGKQIGGNIIDFVCHTKNVKRSVAKNILNSKYNIQNKYNSKTFKHNDFGNMLIDKYHIVKNDNCLYLYYNNAYVLELKDNGLLEKLMIEEFEEITAHQRKEVYSYIEKMATPKEIAPHKYILFNNGILDIETLELIKSTPKLLIRNKIPHNYKEYDKDNEIIEKYILDFMNGDKVSKPILFELIGYCLYNNNPYSSIFFIYGDGSSGKTTFLNTLACIVGDENCSYTIFSELFERFGTTNLIGKLINIGDDCKKGFIDDLSILKQITGKSTFEVEFKGKNKFKYRSPIKLIFSFNNLPRIGESGNQITRRLILIPFKNEFKYNPNNKVDEILLQEETIEYLIYKGIMALNHLLKRNSFTTSKLLIREKNKYLNNLNPIQLFFKENRSSFNNPNISCDDTYKSYQNWCDEKGYVAESKNAFGRQIQCYAKPKQLTNGKRYYVNNKITK